MSHRATGSLCEATICPAGPVSWHSGPELCWRTDRGIGDIVKPLDDDSPKVKQRAQAVATIGSVLGDAVEETEQAVSSVSTTLDALKGQAA